jgi:isoamylase
MGATWGGEGVNFALLSEQSERVELCLFDPKGRHETERDIDALAHGWRTDRPGPACSTVIGCTGPTIRKKVCASTQNKLLLDPYAKQIVGSIKWSDALFGYRVGAPREDFTADRRDSAAGMPRCRVIDSFLMVRRPPAAYSGTTRSFMNST